MVGEWAHKYHLKYVLEILNFRDSILILAGDDLIINLP